MTVDLKFFEKILKLLNNEAQVNEKNITDRTILAWVMKKNHLDMTKLLIEHDAQVDNVDHHEKSLLIWTVKIDVLTVIKLLIDSEINMNLEDKKHKISLITTIWIERRKNKAMIKLFKNHDIKYFWW